MDWADIWKIILCAVGSAGGVGAIIVCSVKFAANIIANRLSQKYEAKTQKEIEKYKSGLDNKIYISKAKFDAEFELYRSLSKSFFAMIKDTTRMIPAGYANYPVDPKDREEYENGLYDKALASTVNAQDVLNSNIPFISKDLYKQYEDLVQLCRIQLSVFEERWNLGSDLSVEERKRFSPDDFKRSRQIKEDFYTLNNNLREYLKRLDVF